MNLHKNARTCPKSRALMVSRVLEDRRRIISSTPLVPLATRATASQGRFFGYAKTATLFSPALDSPNRGRRVTFGSTAA